MKTIFIVNPAAGEHDSSDAFARALAQAVQAVGLSRADYAITHTTHAGHARDLAEGYARAGDPVRLFAVGGDGTFHEVLQGACQYKNAAVGCIPYGSGNDFLRNYGSRADFLDLADQLRGGERDIDLLETDFGVGASICSAGLDAQIAHDIPRFRRLPWCGGTTAYRLSILRNLLRPLGRTLRLTLDEETITQPCLLTAICNGGYYGGGFRAAPDCSLEDGLLDVVFVRKVGLARIARVLPQYQKGLHMQDGQVIPALRDVIDFRRCRSVTLALADGKSKPIVITVDGECHAVRSLTVRVLPKAGRIVLPGRIFARAADPEG